MGVPELQRLKSFADASEKRVPFRQFVDNKSPSQQSKGEKSAIEQLEKLVSYIIDSIDRDESQMGV